MDNLKDISVNVPAEYKDAFIKIIESGLERAKLPAKIRKEMIEWWSVEQCYLRPD